MKIRAAVPEDSEDISTLICVLVDQFIAKDFSSSGRNFLLSTMSPVMINRYMQTGYKYHVAEIRDQLAGVVAIRDNTHLYHLFVAEQFQHKGIAKELWRIAMKASLQEAHTAEFTVNSSAYARDVYKRLGFVAEPGPEEKNGVVFYPMKLQVTDRP